MVRDGSSVEEFIKESREKMKKLREMGYRDTCLGLLSPEDIKEAGLTFNNQIVEEYDPAENKVVRKARGYDTIPSQEYMHEDSTFGRKGSKFIAVSQKFLKWYKKEKVYVDRNEEHIDKLISNDPSVEDVADIFNGKVIEKYE